MLKFSLSKIIVFDIEKRNFNAVKRFAEKERIDGVLNAICYDVLEPFPSLADMTGTTRARYEVGIMPATASILPSKRGFETTEFQGKGLIVAVDHHAPRWDFPQLVTVPDNRLIWYVVRHDRGLSAGLTNFRVFDIRVRD